MANRLIKKIWEKAKPLVIATIVLLLASISLEIVMMTYLFKNI